MVEKMSADVGSSRASNALHKRHDSIKKWKQSDTAKESSVRHPSKFKIKFDKGTVFLSAVSSGDLEETTKLIKEGVDIDHTNVDGLTALHQACIDENQDMVKLLLQKGANIEARDNEGWTPLHAAASAGNVDIAQILIENGANLSAVNNEGEIPLDLAEEEDMEEFLSDEIENQGLEVEEARNEEERLMLEDADKWVNTKKIDEVLDWQGATALHVAAAKGYTKVISLLLQLGVDVNVRDNDGWTPLHAAVHWGSKAATELLTDAGADFELKNNLDQTPCELAEADFLKVAENCRKKSKDVGKKPTVTKSKSPKRVDEEKDSKAIDLLGTLPKRSAFKGGRDRTVSQNGPLPASLAPVLLPEDASEPSDTMSSTKEPEKASEESESDSGSESDSKGKDERPKPTKNVTPGPSRPGPLRPGQQASLPTAKNGALSVNPLRPAGRPEPEDAKDSKNSDISKFGARFDTKESKEDPPSTRLGPARPPSTKEEPTKKDLSTPARSERKESKEEPPSTRLGPTRPPSAKEEPTRKDLSTPARSEPKESKEEPPSTRLGPARPPSAKEEPTKKDLSTPTRSEPKESKEEPPTRLEPSRPPSAKEEPTKKDLSTPAQSEPKESKEEPPTRLGPARPPSVKEEPTKRNSSALARFDSKESKEEPPTRMGPARPPSAKEEPTKKDSSTPTRPPLRSAQSVSTEQTKKDDKKSEDIRSRFQIPRPALQRDEKEDEAAKKRLGGVSGKRGDSEEPVDKIEEPVQSGASGTGPSRPFSLPARPPARPSVGNAPSNSSSATVSKPAAVSDWRMRLAERTRQFNDDSKPEAMEDDSVTKNAADPGSHSETEESRTGSSDGGSDEDLGEEDKQETSQRKRRTLRETRRSTGVAYMPEEDDNESNEPDTKRNTRVNEEIERKRAPSNPEEDSSRMSIADRLRKKNQELISSTSDRSNDRTKSDASVTSSATSVRDRVTRTVITTSSTSTTDSADAKELQRKLDQALKEASEFKARYETIKKEKEDIEKKLEQYKEDIEKLQELKNDNLRLKDENGALIRVISKLSRTPASTTS